MESLKITTQLESVLSYTVEKV